MRKDVTVYVTLEPWPRTVFLANYFTVERAVE